MDILYRFILYLKDHGETILAAAHQHKILIKKGFEVAEFPKNYLTNIDFFNEMITSKQNFLKKTPIRKYTTEDSSIPNVKLSKRQIDCITYLLKNKTSREMAELMNISSRTAESYIENIKFKLNCNSKLELIGKLKSNKFLSALL
jgi:DNA-binding CsgD family transcriptional regulator